MSNRKKPQLVLTFSPLEGRNGVQRLGPNSETFVRSVYLRNPVTLAEPAPKTSYVGFARVAIDPEKRSFSFSSLAVFLPDADLALRIHDEFLDLLLREEIIASDYFFELPSETNSSASDSRNRLLSFGVEDGIVLQAYIDRRDKTPKPPTLLARLHPKNLFRSMY